MRKTEEKVFRDFDQFKDECFGGDAEAAFACLGREGYYQNFEVTLNHKNMRRIMDSLDDHGDERYAYYWEKEDEQFHAIRVPDQPKLLTLQEIAADYGKKTGMGAMLLALIICFAVLFLFWLITGRNWVGGIIFGIPAVALVVTAIVSIVKEKKLRKGEFYLVESVLEKKQEIASKDSESVTQYVFFFKGFAKKFVGFWEYEAYRQGEKFYILVIGKGRKIGGFFSQRHWTISTDDFKLAGGVYRPKRN